ncbi:MAG: hypothetical protein J6P62_05530 [Bacteroidales bacterium]|nr:hypothetical protein [Bacteroidales bacterium]
MDNEKKTPVEVLPDILKDILEGKKKHVDTPSEKICKLAIERDMTYDRIQNYKKKIEADLKSGEDTSFTEMFVKQLEICKNMLGDQIKKLIDET